MARIRSIKPDFFRHAALYEAECETGLPLRVAFAGLWTAADRKGRFRWKPRELKLDCLPFDEVDFARVLDALVTRGFIVRYRQTDENGAHDFGFIPSWRAHQVINPRERQSVLPDPVDCEELQYDDDASSTRDARVSDLHVHACGEGEGEGEGEKEVRASSLRSDGADAPRDFRAELFQRGLQTLAKLTGRGPDACRSFVGKCLKAAGDDAVIVLGLIEDAERNRVIDPTAWIAASLKRREQSNGKQTVHAAADDLLRYVRALEQSDQQLLGGEGADAVRKLPPG